MKQRIWFNRWFRTGTDFIDRIREGDRDGEYEIYVTHHKNTKEYIKRADYFEIEKPMHGKAYIDLCLKFCEKHNIDIFIPKFCLNDISKYISEFEGKGIKVLMAAEHSVMDLVRHKVRFYEDCRKHDILTIPEYYTAVNADEFRAAYENIIKNGSRACYKTVVSEGGLDFRVICRDEEFNEFEGCGSEQLMTFEKAYSGFIEKKEFPEIMVMEYLDGIEYSIDCLAINGKLLAAVPRKKVGWERILEDKAELKEIAEKITRIYNFSYIFNIQVKYKDGIPKLLEVNPRMSGGLNSSCMSGINFPYLAIELLTKGKAEIPMPKYGMISNMKKSVPAKRQRINCEYAEK